MPPVKKRTLKRYTFDSTKYDCLAHKRHLSNFPASSPHVDSAGPSESSCLVLEEPSFSPISPLISGLPTDFCLISTPRQEEQVDCLLTGLPPLPAQLGVSTLSLAGDSGEGEDAPPFSPVEESEEQDVSERRTVRTERIQQRVRGLVMTQREQVRRNLSGEFLLSQKIKTLQVVRKALFVPPRTESEREMRIHSIQKQLRYKQQVKQLFLHVVADIRRVRRVNSLRETDEEVRQERRVQEQLSQQLFRRKLQVLDALCSRMTRLRRDALADREQASEKQKVQVEENNTTSMKSEQKAETALHQGPAENNSQVVATSESWREEQPETVERNGEGWTTSALMRRAFGSCVSGEDDVNQQDKAGVEGVRMPWLAKGTEQEGGRMPWLAKGTEQEGGRMPWLAKGTEQEGGEQQVGFSYKASAATDAMSEGSSVDILSSQESQKGGGEESSGAESSSESSGSESSDSSTADS
eukprot:GHVS01080688.1.p1 GENE.GHVS01080688.1~~GHVS01080688.1.p1  ORF type:complete len:499 (+),score=97.08 GHVS01080688.1:95-1498(+)